MRVLDANPAIGTVIRARDIPSLAGKYGSHKCIWAACGMCGAERWVLLKGGSWPCI